MIKFTTPEKPMLSFASWKKADVLKLESFLQKAYVELNHKFTQQINNMTTIPTVDITSIKKNPQIYNAFVARRDEHIRYFKKYPKYVHQRLTMALEQSKKSVTFHGEEVAAKAMPLAKYLHLEENIARRHANFIARDQLGKFNASINEAQAEYVGATEYIWRTVEDERVRPLHAARNGKKFKFSEPPSDGNAGTPIRCRCTAEAIINI